MGIAAHIRAASQGGPRFDASMTPEQRKSPENAIWLCLSCSKIIDASPDAFTVDGLHAWKKNAEIMAARDSKITSDHVGMLLVEVETARIEILGFCAHWQAFDPSNTRHPQLSFWQRAELHTNHTSAMRAAYHEGIAPRISAVLTSAQLILGPDSREVVKLAKEFEYAETNYLSMIECAKALQKVKDVLALR
ncbi:hypothetical protein OG711_21820 [Streptomyces uncialis]|uniref:hypothetical protein n=1 Tax=Streptomyces uncialis TaxID=1048205 RepID=UPI002E34DCDE|nr:hypothetical protein [Streptomyces uncialis]